MASNGVWLCPTCHRKVDGPLAKDYSAEMLKGWKLDAPAWFQQNMGRPLQAIVSTAEQKAVSRPSANSIRGAQNFHKLHRPLADGLFRLRQQSPMPFGQSISISEEDERQIQLLSTGPKVGKSWKDDWSSTFHCDDSELMEHMTNLIRCVDSLQRQPGSALKGPRSIEFKPADVLAQSVSQYLDVYQAFSYSLGKLESWGI